MNRKYWLLLGLVAVAAAQPAACAPFHSCEDLRNCKPRGGAAGAEAGSAGEAGEQSSDGTAGRGATTRAAGGAAGHGVVNDGPTDGGAAGSAGAGDGGDGGDGNDTERCGASKPCPATAPVCVAGTCQVPVSCAGLPADCGTANESCCTSPVVTGGSFKRDNDSKFPATISDFRLDKYEVTVGRFRKFVAAVVGGWTPAAGSGKHAHLNAGEGLKNSAAVGYETGWDLEDGLDALPANKAVWDSALGGDGKYATWTSNVSSNETRPINYVSWYQAVAFCIWDGGFLPSEAEWSYAAVGGSAQRAYPWGANTPGTNANLAVYGCYLLGHGTCTGVTDIAPVGSNPMGNGLFGQADLVGNVEEHNLDEMSDYGTTCDNCAYSATQAGNVRSRRGGRYDSPLTDLYASWRDAFPPTWAISQLGLRCARTP